MEIQFCNRNDVKYQKMLNKLLKDIFSDFQFWFDLGLWDSNYESYSIVEKGEMAANVSIYKTEVLYKGSPHLALSIGAVATKKEYRGRGLARCLLEHIIAKYSGTPLYLFAHDGVADFYPKFGFRRLQEKQPVYVGTINNDWKCRKLKFDDLRVQKYLYERKNFSQELDCLNTAPLNLFHVHWGYLKDSLFEIPELNTLVIAEQQGTILKIFGVFSLQDILFADLVKYLPFSNVKKIEFGFMPCWPDIVYSMEKQDSEAIYVKNISCDLGDFKFPELSST